MLENMTPWEICVVVVGALLAIAGFINTVGAAFDRIAKARQAAQAPNKEQDTRLDDLEEWRKEMATANLPGRVKALENWRLEAQGMLGNDKRQLDKINNGLEASFMAQLALLDHALNGNNIKQMQDARDGLYEYLTHPNKRKE